MNKNEWINNQDWQERALAAEKTVQVLVEKLKGFYDGEEKTAVTKQLEKVQERSKKVQQKQELMALQQKQLQEYSQKLEVEVANRTREMRVIIDNVTFGFLSVDSNFKIQKGSTKSCMELFDTDSIDGQDLTEVLGLNKKDAGNFISFGEQVFDDFMPEAVTLSQLPNQFKLKDGRTLKLEGKVIRDDNDQISSILFTVSDITSLLFSEKQAAENSCLLRILQNKEGFLRMVDNYHDLIETCYKNLDQDMERIARRHLHTLKGNFYIYGIDNVAELIHHIEDAEVIEKKHLQQVESEVKEFLTSNYDILKVSHDRVKNSEHKVQVSLDLLERVEEEFKQTSKNQELLEEVQIMQLKEVGELLGPIDEMVSRLGDRLGKKVHVELEGTKERVHPKVVAGLFQNISHLIRNSIDHGIEAPNDRGNKTKDGTISIKLENSSDDEFCLRFCDDGRGINTDKVKEVSIKSGKISPSQASSMNENDIMQLIFEDGVTTADGITEFSGRSLGLTAVRQVVEEAHGKIMVKSRQGLGTDIIIRFPKRVDKVAQRKAA